MRERSRFRNKRSFPAPARLSPACPPSLSGGDGHEAVTSCSLILSISHSPQQSVMLDLAKRSRSGKFRLVTKFKKEKNNKNKEVHSSLAAPGTCFSPVCVSGRPCLLARPRSPGLCFLPWPCGSSLLVPVL